MKSYRLLTMLAILNSLFLVLVFYTPELTAKERYEEKFEKSVTLAKDGEITLSNVSGEIEVKSWNKAEVKIDALKVSRALSLSQAKEKAQEVEIEVKKEGNTLRINTKFPKRIFKSVKVSVHYSLMIPPKASIKVKSVSGSITLEEIGGTVKVNAVSGNIEVMDAKEGVDCQTVSGHLMIQDVKGDAELKTVSGKITLERIQGSIEAETVSGGIELREVSKAKVVKVKVLSGRIIYEGEISPDGEYRLKSFSGRVEIIIPSDSAFDLEADTFSGKINSDFEIKILGTISKRKIQGEVNGGGAELSLSTFSGNIYLRKR